MDIKHWAENSGWVHGIIQTANRGEKMWLVVEMGEKSTLRL